MATIDLVTKLPRAECERRLRQTVASEWSLVTDSGVVGKIEADSFRIHKKIYYRNSFQQHLYGRLLDTPDGGTRISCDVREMNFKPILILAGAIALLSVIGALWGILSHRAQLHDVPLVALIAPVGVVPLLIGIGALAVTIGRAAARNERQYLLDFLGRTLSASASA
ncbi:MAG TPA: hypothetical protein VHZ78_13400 [Rhizomicrobium sp.]|jgi:hypothetical protein|nr:hypothetical protein [Rhizomicrobium sp.]